MENTQVTSDHLLLMGKTIHGLGGERREEEEE